MLKFDINAVFTLVNLVIFYLLMKFFLFGRIKKVIEKRQNMIDKQFEDAKETNDAADKKLADYESKLASYEEEGDKIISDAKDTAKAEYDKIITRAEADAKSMKDRAREQIEADTESARKASREEIANLAMQAAEKVVGATVDEKLNSSIFDEFLNEGESND